MKAWILGVVVFPLLLRPDAAMPGTRWLRAQAPGQPAPQQSVCPSAIDFLLGPSRTVTVAAAPARVWDALPQAVADWYQSKSFRSDLSRPLRAERYGITPDIPKSSGHTCFTEKREGNRDTRVAFAFAVKATPGKSARAAAADLELRWLIQFKGSAERTWRTSAMTVGNIDDLITRIQAAAK